MLFIKDKRDCCGCEGCATACPTNCIDMAADKEGFYYPHVNHESCIKCGRCIEVCPIINYTEEIVSEQTGYVIQNRNRETRFSSTSGGAFSAIAEGTLNKGGIVYGAGFDKDFNVEHVAVYSKEELPGICRSKYVQSRINDIYDNVKMELVSGKEVCFSGTPCQVEGLLCYLGKDYDNLITCDLACHSVPSPKLWGRYIKYLETGRGTITHVAFREKVYGYAYSALVLKGEKNEIIYSEGVDTDPYLRAFFSDISVRPSCYDCRFKKRYRRSDFTLWDCFNINEFTSEMDDDIGTTRVLIHTEKGRRLFEGIKEALNYKMIDPDKLTADARELTKSVEYNSKREIFFDDLDRLKMDELIEKYFPKTIKIIIEKRVRVLCAKMGIYRPMIRLYKRINRSNINRYR